VKRRLINGEKVFILDLKRPQDLLRRTKAERRKIRQNSTGVAIKQSQRRKTGESERIPEFSWPEPHELQSYLVQTSVQRLHFETELRYYCQGYWVS